MDHRCTQPRNSPGQAHRDGPAAVRGCRWIRHRRAGSTRRCCAPGRSSLANARCSPGRTQPGHVPAAARLHGPCQPDSSAGQVCAAPPCTASSAHTPSHVSYSQPQKPPRQGSGSQPTQARDRGDTTNRCAVLRGTVPLQGGREARRRLLRGRHALVRLSRGAQHDVRPDLHQQPHLRHPGRRQQQHSVLLGGLSRRRRTYAPHDIPLLIPGCGCAACAASVALLPGSLCGERAGHGGQRFAEAAASAPFALVKDGCMHVCPDPGDRCVCGGHVRGATLCRAEPAVARGDAGGLLAASSGVSGRAAGGPRGGAHSVWVLPDLPRISAGSRL